MFLVVILGGQIVDISLVLVGICEIHVFFTATFFHKSFDIFRGNIEFLEFWSVDLAYENRYN